MHRELRMVGGGRRGEFALRVPAAADALPGLLVEIGVEPRQHHRAMRQNADGVEEACRRRHRTGRTRRDHRPVVMRGEARGFGCDQQIAPRRRLDPLDLRQMRRPCLSRDPQEFERVLPILVELIRHQPVQRLPADAAGDHVVHQARQIAGQRQGRRRAADHQRRQHRAPGPGRDQPRQRQPALEFAELRRNIQRRRATILLGLLGEGQFVLVDVAEGDDARQHGGVRLQHVEKDLMRHAPGAPRRQIERRLREPCRIAAGLEAVDQSAVDQRGDNGAQKRRGHGNVENAHGLPDSEISRI